MKFLVILALTLACVSAATVGDAPILFWNKLLQGRITNGKPAEPGQFPYQAGLLINRSTWCGGSLISDSWILTAAHCTVGAKEVAVYLGSTKIQVAQTVYIVSPNDIYQHKNYTPLPNLANDISLIKIPRVTFTSEIQPVKLPAIAESYPSYAGDYAVASGWGKISDDEQYVDNQLNYAQLEIIPNSVCVAAYGSKTVTEKVLCVATPSGFVRVTSYLDWIKNITGVYY